MNELLPRTRSSTLASYADTHELFDLFERIVSRMVIEKPDDVIQFMIEQLQKPETHGIIVLGPPTSGQTVVSEQLALHLNAVHISTGRLLSTAIERQTSLGTQARPYLERGHYVPDNVMLGLVTARLQDPECLARGYVLEGFPRTKEQAKGLISRGILPTRIILFELSDDMVMERRTQLRIDPITNRLYHLTTDPPPHNSAIQARLIQRQTDTDAAVRARLDQYRRHLPGVMGSFDKDRVRRITFEKDFVGLEAEALRIAIRDVASGKISRAPRMIKCVMAGLPGSGRTSASEMVVKEFGVVLVSPRTVILEELSLQTRAGKDLAAYVENPEDAPDNLIMPLIANRLKREDSLDRGWVLDGFPRTKAQADGLREQGIVPNRIIFLQASPETCKTRLTQRRYDPLTNRQLNLHTTPQPQVSEPLHYTSLDAASWPMRGSDTADKVESRLQAASTLRSELETAYSGGRGASRQGRGKAGGKEVVIMQEVDAEGIGSENNEGIVDGLETVLDRVRGALIRGGIAAVVTEAK